MLNQTRSVALIQGPLSSWSGSVAGGLLALALLATPFAARADTNANANGAPGGAAAAPQQSPAAQELRELVTQIQKKLQSGKPTEADLGEELKQFDALLAKHKGEKTEDVARILMMKAMLYLEVLNNPEKGSELIQQVKRDFPDTRVGQNADKILANIQQQVEAAKIQKTLTPGTPFPDFQEKDLAGKPLSVGNYKGKVVLVDFWATWCGPCVQELPNVLKTYEKHHPEGFEIIGISLDEDKEKLTSFIQSKKMTWPQYFDGKGWENKLAEKYGVKSIPATYLLDRQGKIIGRDLRGEELESAVTKALGAK